MRSKTQEINSRNDKLNSKVGRTLTYKELLKLEFPSKLNTKATPTV